MKNYIYILLLFNSFICFGQMKTALDVSNLPNSVKPGQHFSMFFNMTTSETLPATFQTKLNLPNNWKILVEKVLYLTKDSLSKKYLYTISTPSQGAAGRYTIDFQITSNGQIVDHKQADILLEEVRKLEITALNKPEYVKEGDVLKVSYLIQNIGNKTERVKLQTTRGVVENTPDSVDIKPNSFIKIIVKQDIPQTEVATWDATSDLKVGMTNQIAPIFQSVSVPVYSSKIKQNDPYLRIPLNIGGGYLNYTIGKKTVSAYQYFAEGKGYWDFSKKHFVDFILRGPNQFDVPAIGNYDQYSVSYSYLSKTNITAGDYVLKVNNLMEFGRFGRGLKVEQNFKKSSLMVFYQEPRFFPNQKNAFGSRYKINLKGESHISLNFVSKNLTDDTAHFRSNLLGVTTFVKNKWGSNETEFDLGEAKGKIDLGFFNRLIYRRNQLSINSDIIYTGKNFYGFYTNSLLFANGLNYYLTKKLNFGVNSNISKINPSLDALKYAVSPYSTTHSAYLTYQLSHNNLLSVNFTKQESEDRQKPSSFHYKENFGNLSYNLSNNKMTLFAQTRYGFAQNLKAIDSTARKNSMSVTLQPSVALMPWFWIGGFFEYQHTSKFSTANRLEDLYFYGGNMHLNYKKHISLNFMYRNNYAPDEFIEKRSFVDGSLVFDYDKHQFNLTTGKAFVPNEANNNQNTLFLSAKYILKFNAPIKKNKHLGQLRGQITTLSEGIKKDGILLQLGQYKVLTDSNGSFYFPNLMPNKYFITLSNEGNLTGVIPTIKTPIEVDIKANTTESLIIPLIKTGGVVGKIILENTKKDSVTTPSVYEAVGVIYIKIFNEKESIITQMNDKNEFSFKEIKPGTWKLKAIIPAKSEQFEVLNQEQEVIIESGQIKQSAFTVKAIERKVKFSGKSFHITTPK